MDDRRFDAFTRSLAKGANRRTLMRGLLGLGAAALAGSRLDAEAARRPTPTPRPPTCPGRQTWNGSACVCPADAPDACGPDCCTPGASVCCDHACCFGTCYGEELCCPTGQIVCNGECLAPGQCCTTSDCDTDTCATVQCTSDRECLYTEDCNLGGAEQCCTEGEICLENGACCSPTCPDGACGGDDGCGGTCQCGTGQTCAGGVCARTCDPFDPESCPSGCQCTSAFYSGTFCFSSNILQPDYCTITGCPSGYVCDLTNICYLPCT